MDPARFAPSLRLQDELHLLKDSLGAVDSHYEGLFDHLQQQLSGYRPTVLASSATLSGFEKQVDVLYQREGRVFPQQGPSSREGFWTTETEELERRFVAVAPRGVTLEYTVDRMLTELQRAIRELVKDPARVCDEAAVDRAHADFLVSQYGVNVVYGNSMRDVEAAARSIDTQVLVEGELRVASLTGRTGFEEVRDTLKRLEEPEAEFGQRLHVVAASAMMSHGVDVDRLNTMLVLGLPLTTAEFIQTTARVGRRWPGLVFVLHKIARERDAGVYRSFKQFVRQGDRFVEAVPVTRRSRRVLQQTIAGIAMARLLMIHEHRSGYALTTIAKLRQYYREGRFRLDEEVEATTDALGIRGPLDEPMRATVRKWFEMFFRNLQAPSGNAKFPSELCPWGGPMRSLRDVEEQAPIFGALE